MMVSEGADTSASRKKMRFTIPPLQTSVHFRGEIEENHDNDHYHGGYDSEEESIRDQELSESDSNDEEEGQDEEDEQVEEEIQRDQEPSESNDDDEGQDEEESQSNQERSESDGDGVEGQDVEDEQGEGVSEGGSVHKGSSEPKSAPLSTRTMIANMTLDEDTLECGICCLPLKPPIFQCDVGHVVCSSCRDKLAVEGKCHVCCTFITGGYRRCHAMEQLVESIRGSCPNAAYGCAVRMAYYDQHTHLQVCPHAPCHCPAEACGFIGSTAALLEHFICLHKWTCTTGVQVGERLVTSLHDGFNVIAAVCGSSQYLFLLNVARTPFGRVISALCLHPQATADESSSSSPSKNVECELHLFYSRYSNKRGDRCCCHSQESKFKVACTDLSNGLPNPNDSFQFIVPNSVQPDNESPLTVIAYITIKAYWS